MKIFENLAGKDLTLTFCGTFNETSCPHIDDKISEVMGWDINRIFLNMAGVDYISSIGIRTLIIAHKSSLKNGKDLILAEMSEKVREILSEMGMLTFFMEAGRGRT
jgi:anti-anti-sigma factor